jgi:hypothetical protein
MTSVLEHAHWKTFRVSPYDDLAWIDERWFPLVRNAIVESAPNSIAAPFSSGSPGRKEIGEIRGL